MKINTKDCRIYFLTNNNPTRKTNIINEFNEYNLLEVNSDVSEKNKHQSFCTGWSRMIDSGLKNQNRNKPFQPFICLEDDVKKYRDIPDYIEVPDDIDILYIGLSKWGCTNILTGGLGLISFSNINDNLVRVYNMLASHGIMICSPLGAIAIQKAMIEGYFKNKDCDLFIASQQRYYNVYALRKPLVYQCEDNVSATKFEINQTDNIISEKLIKNDTVGVKCINK